MRRNPLAIAVTILLAVLFGAAVIAEQCGKGRTFGAVEARIP